LSSNDPFVASGSSDYPALEKNMGRYDKITTAISVMAIAISLANGIAFWWVRL
jgi:hypothetical protein